METFQPFAQPWWVNLLLFIPLIAYVLWRGRGLSLSWPQLAVTTVFAAAFGYVEAAVVVYLRAAIGLLPGYTGTLSDVARLSVQAYQQAQSANQLPQSLATVEVVREAATMFMLVAVALLAAPRTRERWAIFLWAFSIWDISYYGTLWATVRWPFSLTNQDVLFLIPVPWLSQVWFPLLVSTLTLLGISLAKTNGQKSPQTK
jgi:hypothetical protein